MIEYLVMSVERQQIEESSRFKKDFKGQVVAAGIRLAAPILRHGTERVMRNLDVKYEDGFDDQIRSFAKDGKLFLLVTDHQSLADTLACFEPADKIREIANLPGYFLPYTMTLATGDKGADTKGLQDVQAQTLDEHFINRVFLSRSSDQKNFNTKANLRGVRDEIKDYLLQGFGGIIHAEGNLNAAREKGVTEAVHNSPFRNFVTMFQSERKRLSIERNGMQPFERNSLRSIINLADEEGLDISIVPITTSGTYNIYDPSTGTLTRSAIRTGFHLADQSLAKVFVSNPMDINEGELGEIIRRHKRMTKEDWDEFNAIVAKKIASHLPNKMRGIYRTDTNSFEPIKTD